MSPALADSRLGSLHRIALSFGYCVAVALASGVPLSAWADTPSPAEIHITGDSTLGNDEIARISGLDRKPDLPAEEIRKRLLNTGLFSYVDVSRAENQVTIRLHQKVTWFVFPYVSSDPTGTYYSLVGGKAILAKEDVFTFARYQAGTGDHEGNIGLIGQYLLGSPWDAGLTYGFANQLRWIYSGRDITSSTVNQFQNGSVEIGYRLSLAWKVSLSNYIEYHRFDVPEGGYSSGMQWSHKVSLTYDQFYSIYGLGAGFYASAYAEATDPLSDFHFYKVGAQLRYSIFNKGDVDWVIYPNADYSSSLPYYQLFPLGGESLRGFPSQQFRDRYEVSVLNDFYLHTWKVWFFRPRLLLVADWAFIQAEGRTSVGGGIQFGIRDLLASAIQVIGAYGFNPNGFTVTFSLGKSFSGQLGGP